MANLVAGKWLLSKDRFSGHAVVDSPARHVRSGHRRFVLNGKGRVIYSNTFTSAHRLRLSVALLGARADDLIAELE